MKQYILAIDQGTTSTRAILFNQTGNIVCTSQREFKQICPNNGWVEHNPEEIWEITYQTIRNVIYQSKIPVKEIKAIGITNQRETTVIWHKETGKPVYNAIVWQSRQSQKICEDLIEQGYLDLFYQKTGLIINPYFSASKIKWIFEHNPTLYSLAKEGKLLFGTIDTYLIWKLTNHQVHATDYSNASRTMIYNIYDLKWDDELLKILDIPINILPQVYPSSYFYGQATGLTNIDPDFINVPITGVIGDQQAALFGQCCFQKGDAKSTYGTGCFILMTTGQEAIKSKNGLLTTIAWGLNGEIEYALEGSVFVGGSVVQWLRDEMEFFKSSADCERYLVHDNPSNGVYFVPAFVGMGTPYWDNDARGAIFGLTRATTKENIIGAALEGICYQVYDVIKVMQEEASIPIKYLAVDGGASVNDYMMQFQANLLDVKLMRSSCKETTAMGAAYLAGLTVGIFQNKDMIEKLHLVDKVFLRDMDEKEVEKKLSGWKKAIKATLEYK